MSLGEQRIEAGGKIFDGVVDRDNDGDFGSIKSGSEGISWGFGGATEDKFVVKKIIEDHSHEGSKTENTGRFDKIVVKWEVENFGELMNKSVDWGDKTKKPSKEGADDESGDAVPEEKHKNTAFSNGAFFPGDFGVKNKGEDGGEDIGDDAIKPKKCVCAHDDTGNKGINCEVEKSENDADKGKFADTDGGFGWFLHRIIIASFAEWRRGYWTKIEF